MENIGLKYVGNNFIASEEYTKYLFNYGEFLTSKPLVEDSHFQLKNYFEKVKNYFRSWMDKNKSLSTKITEFKFLNCPESYSLI